jgi:site-specific recombinase XerC
VDDVTPDGRRVRSRVRLRAETTKNGRRSDVFLPDRLVRKLERFLRWKRMMGESLVPEAPLFVSSWGRRLSARRAQTAFAEWQRRAGFDRGYCFHTLRHAAITCVYRMTRDLFLAQRFARHASPLTTTVYTHVSDEDMAERLHRIRC